MSTRQITKFALGNLDWRVMETYINYRACLSRQARFMHDVCRCRISWKVKKCGSEPKSPGEIPNRFQILRIIEIEEQITYQICSIEKVASIIDTRK